MLGALYCETQFTAKGSFDRRSFRWVRRGKHRILVGCPRGKWNNKTKRCKVGTRAYKKFSPARGNTCPVGAEPIRK